MGKKQSCVILILIILMSSGCINQENTNVGNNTEGTKNISIEVLENSLHLAADYLNRMTKPDGEFVYLYNASNNVFGEGYNMLRHAGTVYTLLKLYDFFNDTILLESAEQALDFLLSHVKILHNYSCIEYKDEVKLGGNALAIIALVEYMQVTNTLEYLPLTQDLARFIVHAQKDSGEFISEYSYSTGEPSDFQSDYYPGEAILALTRLYAIDQNNTWINTAEKAAIYLIDDQQDAVSGCNLIPDHWLLISLNELYRVRGHEEFLNHSIQLSNCILSNQRGGFARSSEKEEWVGSYDTPPRSASTAIFTEALIAVYHLIEDYRPSECSESILTGIKLGVSFQLQTQFTNKTMHDVSHPDFALGGFHHSLDNNEIRIDYVQHNVCGILGYMDILTQDN